MDLKLFKLDIDELINEFAQCGSTTFAEFKRVWLLRKFSFIFEASPSTNQGFFMQSLYAHSISYMVSADSLSNRLGGLYCLYCLYETQPFKPPFKIYLSLAGVKVVSALLKRMLERNMFLFGFVGVNEGSATERISELTDIQNAKVQTAYEKLFADSQLEHFIHMDMGMELDVDLLKKRSSEYAGAKELALKEASRVMDIQDVKHIADTKRSIGDIVEHTAGDWNSQKELFYEQTGFGHPVAVPPHQEENGYTKRESSNENLKRNEPCDNLERQEGNQCFEEQQHHDTFGKELEALLFRPLEFDGEDFDPAVHWEEDT